MYCRWPGSPGIRWTPTRCATLLETDRPGSTDAAAGRSGSARRSADRRYPRSAGRPRRPATAPRRPRPRSCGCPIAHRAAIGSAGAELHRDGRPGRHRPGRSGRLRSAGTTGEGLVGPITIGVDATGVPRDGSVNYVAAGRRARLHLGHPVDPAVAGRSCWPMPVSRSSPLATAPSRSRWRSVAGVEQVLARTSRSLTFGPTDGTHVMAVAPVVAPVVEAGQSAQVRYDLHRSAVDRATIGVPLLKNPALIVSSVDHWSPFAAPLFRIAYSVPLTATSGTVTVPGVGIREPVRASTASPWKRIRNWALLAASHPSGWTAARSPSGQPRRRSLPQVASSGIRRRSIGPAPGSRSTGTPVRFTVLPARLTGDLRSRADHLRTGQHIHEPERQRPRRQRRRLGIQLHPCAAGRGGYGHIRREGVGPAFVAAL